MGVLPHLGVAESSNCGGRDWELGMDGGGFIRNVHLSLPSAIGVGFERLIHQWHNYTLVSSIAREW